MSTITLEDFVFDWKRDWILRTLILDHLIYWRGARKSLNHANGLIKFLEHNSLAHTSSQLSAILQVYIARGYFVDLNSLAEKTGLISPHSYDIIYGVAINDYNLERLIKSGYHMGDFLYDIYGKKKDAELNMIRSFLSLFEESLGLSVKLFVSTRDNIEHDYLRITWEHAKKKFAWWVGYQPGGFLHKDDDTASGLTVRMAHILDTLSAGNAGASQFLTLCAADVSTHAINTTSEINDTYKLSSPFTLIMLTSLVKLVTWGDRLTKENRNKLPNLFERFFVNQDNPLSVTKGIDSITTELIKS